LPRGGISLAAVFAAVVEAPVLEVGVLEVVAARPREGEDPAEVAELVAVFFFKFEMFDRGELFFVLFPSSFHFRRCFRTQLGSFSPNEVLDPHVDHHAGPPRLRFPRPVQQRRDPIGVGPHEVHEHVVVDLHVALLPGRVRVNVERLADLGLREVAVELGEVVAERALA